jgi:phosphinothricin acetyltransferase
MIRAARQADFDSIASITNHYVMTTAIHFAYEPVSAADLAASWAAGAERYPWLVADEGDRVVGYAKAGRWRDRDAYAWTAEVGLYLAPDHLGRGLGRTLYQALIDQVAQRGFRSVIAGITMPNDPSVALHRALGFISVGTVRDAGYKRGAWHDVEFWQLRLATGAGSPVP